MSTFRDQLTQMLIQSVSFLATFVLAMIQYPAVQRHADAELGSVLGPDRLPTFGDMHSLPYLSVVTKLPLGGCVADFTPHRGR